MKICSACLLGVPCRYDGQSKPNQKILELSRHETLIPICPEQMGGRPTPRAGAEIIGDRVVDKDGLDVTADFQKGAELVLALAQEKSVDTVILKQRSPSCGCGQLMDGTFTGTVIAGDGITTRLLKAHNIKVLTEEDF